MGGCVLYRAIGMFSAMAGLQFALCLAFYLVLRRNWSYENVDIELPAKGTVEQQNTAAADAEEDVLAARATPPPEAS